MKTNRLGYPVLSDELHKRLFCGQPRNEISDEQLALIEAQYRRYELPFPVTTSEVPEYDFQLPEIPIKADDPAELFEKIGKEFAEPYDTRLKNLYANDIPPVPTRYEIVRKAGWYRYVVGQPPEPVPHPLEDTFVFDSETLVTQGNFPIIATAVSHLAWYIWLAPEIENPELPYQPRLFPLGYCKLAIAHNASFDSCRTVEHRDISAPWGKRNVFFDTMAAHIVTAGYSGPQRSALYTGAYFPWAKKGCKNSLVDCYNYYVWPEVPLGDADKELRDIFVIAPDCNYIVNQFDDVMHYSLMDVKYLFDMARAQYPWYRANRPSWVSLSGFLQQSTFHLPVKEDWFEWIARVDAVYADHEQRVDRELRAEATVIANQYKDCAATIGPERLQQLLDNPHLYNKANATEALVYRWLSCPWLGTLDWTVKPRSRKLKGYPEWFRKMPDLLTSKSRLTHTLLKLKWAGQPITFIKGMGWCYEDPDTKRWTRVPRPQGGNVAVLLCKDFKDEYKPGGRITTDDPLANKVLQLALAMSYWTSIQSRVKDQIAAYGNNDRGVNPLVISPNLVVQGTVSGRSVERLFLTVSDIKAHKIGTECKSRFQAPDGWELIQADMSGQELRFFAALADAALGVMGSTVCGFNVMAGNKEDGTDPHTKLAQRYEIERDFAKTCYYALVYGAGAKTIAKTIYLAHGGRKTMAECIAMANDLIAYRKGSKLQGKTYAGGTDSEGFTALERIGNMLVPETPMLGAKMTLPLRPANVGREFHSSRCNWGVQSGGRDQLDCFITMFNYMARVYNIEARVVWSYHDEMVALCADDQTKEAVWLYNVVHAYTWALLAYKTGVNELCMVNTFFDDVKVSSAFTKNPNLDGKYCQTISNPDEVTKPDTIYTIRELAEQQLDKLLVTV